MAIYRPPKSRWPPALAAGLAGLVLGALGGALYAGEDPDPVVAAREVRAALLSAAGSLEVAAVEYEESVRDGEVVERAEYRGARDALQSSRASFEDVRAALVLLAPERAAQIGTAYDGIESMVEHLEDPAVVTEDMAELRRRLSG